MNRARALAWTAHAYTACGLLVSAGIAALLVSERPSRFRDAFLLMVVGTLIDATDGWLARRARVKEVLPEFDGRRLDDIIDFLNYTFLPLFLLYQAEVLPPAWSPLLCLPLVASVFGFCQTNAKTDDGFFLGFPSYWNIVAFYLCLLRPAPWLTALFLAALALLTFVPAVYLYPSQRGRANTMFAILGIPWAAALLACLWTTQAARAADGPIRTPLVWASLIYPAAYMLASWSISIARWRRVGISGRVTEQSA